MKISGYFNPSSSEFHACKDFNQLTKWERLKVITVTALAALGVLFLRGIRGVAALFRVMVARFSPSIERFVRPIFGQVPTPPDQEVKENFESRCQRAIPKALEVHAAFAEENQPAFLNEEGIAEVSFVQFTQARQLLSIHFPFVSESCSEKQDCVAAQLMRIILCGGPAVDLPLPRTSRCFLIRQANEKPEEFVHLNAFYTDHYLKEIQKAQSLQSNFEHTMELFVKDVVERSLFSFCIGEAEPIALGRRYMGLITITRLLRSQLLRDWQTHPEKLGKMIAKEKSDQSFAQHLKQWFPVENDEKELFSEEQFKEVLQGTYRLLEGGKSILERQRHLEMRQLYRYCRVDDAEAASLARKAPFSAEDVQSLVRIRFLQIISLMNQGLLADGWIRLMLLLNEYKGEGKYSPVLTGRSSKAIFQVDPGQALQNVSVIQECEISLNMQEFPPEQESAVFEREVLKVATVHISDRIEGFASGTAKRCINPRHALLLSWVIPESILESMVST